MPRIVFVDAATCTVSASPTVFQNDGIASSVVTVRALHDGGEPMQGLAAARITLSSTGTNNTFVAIDSACDANGDCRFTFTSTTAQAKTISATICGAAVTDTASVTVSAASGTVATVTDISRDAANTDGGDTVVFTITDPVDLPTVTFDGVSATGITLLSSTQLQCIVPANAAGLADIIVGGVNFVNPRAAKIGGDFEYLPVASTTFLNENFNGGTLPATFGTAVGTGAITVQTAEKYSGTHAVQAALTGSDVGGDECYIFNSTNIAVSAQANGVYVRYYQKYSADTVANLGDQIKSWLFRTVSGSGQPGWIMQGIGPDFPDGGDPAPTATFVSFIDNGILNINGTPNQGRSGVESQGWTEWIQWQSWDGSAGRCKQWVNGKLLFDVTSASLGGTGTDYRFRLGIPFIQNRDSDCTVWIDEVFAGNGFPNAVVP